MGRSHILAALATAAFAIIITLQLISHFGAELSIFSNQTLFGYRQHRQSPSELGSSSNAPYLLGIGKADITGPSVEINLMGYADPNQLGTGLRQRIYSRAFIVGIAEQPEDRFVYVVLDTQSGDTAVRYGILKGLAALGENYGVYGQKNVAVIGTHSHSGPGAWLNYLLPQITSKGFSWQSYQAIVDGAVLSIQRAHESLRPGILSVGSTEIEDANINRSLYAYLANPADERSKHKHNVDKTMTLLKFTDATSGEVRGVLTWFPVHGTSMLGNNTLISGDNKGVAALMLEKAVSGMDGIADDFAGGFSQANVGDTSPNVLGAYCEDGSNEQCSFKESTCNGKNEPCHGRGPRFREKDQGASSCYEIGRRQCQGARTMLDQMHEGGTQLSGPVKSFHTFNDLSSFTFPHPNGSLVHTCPAALGYSFAAGTTDGPGAFDFRQNNPGDPTTNPVWGVVRNLIKKPSAEQSACHAPKPILLDVGEIQNPYPWAPNIVDVQILRVGQLLIIVSPGEATTMAGRRWQNAIAAEAKALSLTGEREPIVVLGGPANSYTHYIATEEEYAIQRYEGASTLYGPHTLNAHINLTTSSLHYLSDAAKGSPPPGPEPPNNVNRSLTFITGVVRDGTPLFKDFGDVLKDVKGSYHIGEQVSVSFVGANPRNNLRLEGTYAAIETLVNGQWEMVRDDSDWDLVFRWERKNTILGTSDVKIEWKIEEDTKKGRYRVRYFGDIKSLGGTITPFEGSSEKFEVV